MSTAEAIHLWNTERPRAPRPRPADQGNVIPLRRSPSASNDVHRNLVEVQQMLEISRRMGHALAPTQQRALLERIREIETESRALAVEHETWPNVALQA